ncbi:hypothetical protein DMUE_0224 [Dictyocoela muelleri]|nr:hypothetical protein DMUE_0224 [Dictyocoela muelleri]
MIGYSPNEIVFFYSELDPLKRKINYDLNEVIKKSDINKQKSVKNSNKNKKTHSFKIGDLIFIKNESHSKEDKKWIGPFSISKLGSNFVYVNEFDTPINFRKIRVLRGR